MFNAGTAFAYIVPLLLIIVVGCSPQAASAQSRVIQFPPKAIGRLFDIDRAHDVNSMDNVCGKFIGPACGKVTVPDKARLVLEIDSRLTDGKSSLPDTNFKFIQVIRLRYAESPDSVMNFLARQTSLQRLELLDCEFSDAALTKICGLTNLRFLCIRNCGLNGNCFTKLQGLKQLTFLNTSSNTLKQSAFQSIARLEGLRGLDAARTGMNDEGLAYIARNTKIIKLNLNSNGGITARGIKTLNPNKNLQVLRMFKTSITLCDIMDNLDGQPLTEVGLQKKATLLDIQKFKKKFPLCRLGFEGNANSEEQVIFAPTH